MFRSINASAVNDPVYPTVAMQLSADYIEYFNPATGVIHVHSAPAQGIQAAINNGPYAGYRDQAAAFSVGDTINFFRIYGTAGESAISSLRGVTQGPILPAGYDSFAYSCTVVLGASGVLNDITAKSGKHFYNGSPLVWDPTISADPGQVEHFLSLAAWVPSNAQDFTLLVDSQIVSNNGAGASSLNRVGAVSGKHFVTNECLAAPAGAGLPSANAVDAPCCFPNLSRGVFYDWYDFVFFNANSIQHRWMSLYVQGYTVPC